MEFQVGDIVCVKPADEIIEEFQNDGPSWILSEEYMRLKDKILKVISIDNWSYITVLDEDSKFKRSLHRDVFQLQNKTIEVQEEELSSLLF